MWNSSDALPPLLFRIKDRYERYNQRGLHHPPTGVSAMSTFPLFNVVLGADLGNFGVPEFDFGADFGAAFSNFGGDFDNFGDFFGISVSIEWDDVSLSASVQSPRRRRRQRRKRRPNRLFSVESVLTYYRFQSQDSCNLWATLWFEEQHGHRENGQECTFVEVKQTIS